MEHSPTLCVEAVCSPALFQPCFENFSGSHSASLEHNASSAERILSAPSAKLQIISETNKKKPENLLKVFGCIKL